jgi:ABC-type nickel/cobalt efflux system permease component RcnA
MFEGSAPVLNGILFVLALVMGTGFFLFVAKLANMNHDKKATEYQRTLKKWEKDYEAWNQLYICYRDGTIFSPNDAG